MHNPRQPLDGVLPMYTLSLLFWWIPGAGGLVAGLAGGMRVKSVAIAVRAAVMPAVCFVPAVYLLLPESHVLIHHEVPCWTLYLAGLFTGAVLGGWLGAHHPVRRFGWLRSSANS